MVINMKLTFFITLIHMMYILSIFYQKCTFDLNKSLVSNRYQINIKINLVMISYWHRNDIIIILIQKNNGKNAELILNLYFFQVTFILYLLDIDMMLRWYVDSITQIWFFIFDFNKSLISNQYRINIKIDLVTIL